MNLAKSNTLFKDLQSAQAALIKSMHGAAGQLNLLFPPIKTAHYPMPHIAAGAAHASAGGVHYHTTIAIDGKSTNVADKDLEKAIEAYCKKQGRKPH